MLSVEVFRRAIDDLVEFFQAAPDAVACDLHPDYASTRHAEGLAARVGRAAGARAASSRPRGGLHGRARLAGPGAGVRLGRHRLRPRRHGLGRRGAVCEGAGVPPGGPPAHVCPARRRSGRARAAPLGPGPAVRDVSAIAAAEHAAAWFTPAEIDALLSMLARPSTRRAPAAWAGCSTPWPRSAACRR